jgi:hypothetical protein
VPDLDLVAVLQLVRARALAVDLGAVGGLQIFDRVRAGLLVEEDDRVLAADVLVQQGDIGGGIAPDQRQPPLQITSLALAMDPLRRGRFALPGCFGSGWRGLEGR